MTERPTGPGHRAGAAERPAGPGHRAGAAERPAGAAGRPRRWLLIASHVPASGVAGGMVRYTVELARALAERDDVQLHALVQPPARDFFVDEVGLPPGQVLGQPWPGIVGASMAEVVGLPVGGRGRHWDVVQGSKHLLPRHRSGVGLLTVHDMILLDRRGDFDPLKRALLPGFYRRSLRSADVLVAVSEATRQRLVHHLPQLAGQVRVVPLALAPGLTGAGSDPVPGLVDRPFALVVGDPSPRKNRNFVLELWPRVRIRVPEAVLAVVGPSRWARSGAAPGATEWAEAALHQPGIEALGHLPEAQLRWAYERCRVTLCPSRQEGFGLPALEAAAFGAPVLTSGDPALMEASGPDALHLSLDDAAPWVDAIVDRLGRTRRSAEVPMAPRCWADVADETVAAVRGVRWSGQPSTLPTGPPAVPPPTRRSPRAVVG